jgi:hypothetical protein
MLKKGIVHYVAASHPTVKCPNIERYNRTLKTRLWKYFTQRNTLRYINVLQTIISSINHSISQPLGCRPVDVNRDNEDEIRVKLYGKTTLKRPKYTFAVGDRVRIAKEKGKFQKGYLSNYTREVFIITQRMSRDPPVYRIRDETGEELAGVFYAPELVIAVEDMKRTKRYR